MSPRPPNPCRGPPSAHASVRHVVQYAVAQACLTALRQLRYATAAVLWLGVLPLCMAWVARQAVRKGLGQESARPVRHTLLCLAHPSLR